ncbi:thioredoxin domain-containing protein [Gulosibacter chungangensis]|uniref:Thioredoxin domain-containing protein n=1 Tax=Gulosibacter chungangensis TaxID=979746 RepID=A0A7J5B9H3_9MICO|nr:thioredoxin domain-containing protein [Gulosibacter chungangensis]
MAANIARQWDESAAELTAAARKITDTLKYSRDHYAGALAFTEPGNKHAPLDELLPDPPKRSDFDVDATVAKIREQYDNVYGGFGEDTKFLHAPLLHGLLNHNFEGWVMAYGTLLAIIRGGVHDVVGGGFMPYSTVRSWGLPHFEKMLADNAQMLTVFSLATSKANSLGLDARGFQRAAFGIIDWLEREMQASAGGFVTSLDSEAADAQGERYPGIQIAWSRAQTAEVLGEDSEWACEVFGLNTLGSSDTALMLPTFKHDP